MGLVCLNFINSDDNLVCAFSIPAISIVQHPSFTGVIHARRGLLLTSTFRKPRMEFRLRVKEVSAGAENGVALPLRNFQEESIWLQVRSSAAVIYRSTLTACAGGGAELVGR
jgi:hypothetical protein